MSFTVTAKAMRPASDKRECFYCHQAIGQDHLNDCVLIHRKATVRMIVEYEVEVPAHWTCGDVALHRNESGWCASNAIEELENETQINGCLCNRTKFECLNVFGERILDEG